MKIFDAALQNMIFQQALWQTSYPLIPPGTCDVSLTPFCSSYPTESVSEAEHNACLILVTCSGCVCFRISPLFLCFYHECVGCAVKLPLLWLFWEVKNDPESAQIILFWKSIGSSVQFLCLTFCLKTDEVCLLNGAAWRVASAAWMCRTCTWWNFRVSFLKNISFAAHTVSAGIK